MRTRLAFLVGAAALSVGACATAGGAYGSGVGYAYGYDSPDGFNCYNDGLGGYGAYGGYGVGNCGWYEGYFYPGYGGYVFDRHHHRHEMNGHQHDHFTRQARGPDGERRVGLGSSGGVVPPSLSQPQSMPGSGMSPEGLRGPGLRIGMPGPRDGFGGGARDGSGGGARGGFGGSAHGGFGGGARGGLGGSHGGGRHG